MIPDVQDGDYGWHDHMVRLNCLELALAHVPLARAVGEDPDVIEIAERMYKWVLNK